MKTSLGATKTIPWEVIENCKKLIDELKKEGHHIIVVEQDSRSVDYRTIKNHQKRVFIFGNEIGGVPKEICDCADVVIEIPMHGTKESLNVSTTVGIILFENLPRN